MNEILIEFLRFLGTETGYQILALGTIAMIVIFGAFSAMLLYVIGEGRDE